MRLPSDKLQLASKRLDGKEARLLRITNKSNNKISLLNDNRFFDCSNKLVLVLASRFL